MHATTCVLSVLFATAASTEVVSFPNVFNGTQATEAERAPWAMEKIGEDASLTTYLLDCPPAETTYCPSYWEGYTYKINPTSLNAAETDHNPSSGGADYTRSIDCTIPPVVSGTITTATCTESYGGTEANFPGVTTETYEYEGYLTYSLVGGVPKSTSASVTPTTTATRSVSTSISVSGSGGAASDSITSTPSRSTGIAGSISGSASVGSQTTSTSTSSAISLAVAGRFLVATFLTAVAATLL